MASTKSIRQIKLVDMVKRHNEGGTAFSKAERKKREREVDLTIPGYEQLEVLMSSATTPLRAVFREDDDEEMEDGKDDDGDKAEEVVSNRELAEMLPTKTMKKSKKRSQNGTTTPMSTMKALSPRKIHAKQQSKISPDEARVPLRVKRGHSEGDKYYGCYHCDYICRVTKASHNNYSSLEGHLATYLPIAALLTFSLIAAFPVSH
ncbi:hypothetical protein BT69DRAFT_1354959 [Atractiella rhizophila]|nr:hypothetical protein BT69DRAFT_1354959 [Atractiella rhizophila]